MKAIDKCQSCKKSEIYVDFDGTVVVLPCNEDECEYEPLRAKDEGKSMTNREWLNSMTDEELVCFLLSEDFSRLKMSWTSTFLGLKDWLKKEHTEGWING
ncbi:MAG: hypothetical protein IKU45_03865 [Clostridia bacterium]|nr:hypothetical protein [Clostridia bacterium]